MLCKKLITFKILYSKPKYRIKHFFRIYFVYRDINKTIKRSLLSLLSWGHWQCLFTNTVIFFDRWTESFLPNAEITRLACFQAHGCTLMTHQSAHTQRKILRWTSFPVRTDDSVLIPSIRLILSRFATFSSQFLLYIEILHHPPFSQLLRTPLFCFLKPAGSLIQSGTPPTADRHVCM